MNLKRQYKENPRLTILAILTLIPDILIAKGFQEDVLFDAEHIHVYIVAGLFISTFVLLFYNFLYIFREHDINNLQKSQNARLALVLQAGRLRLWVYDTNTRHYKILSETGILTEEYNPIDFAHFYDRDDFEVMRAAIFDISENRRLSSTVNVKSNSDNGDVKHYSIHLSIDHRNERGHVARILGVQHDITAEHEKKEHANELLMRYHTVFNSALIDMMYYDKDGILTEINETAHKTFQVTESDKYLGQKPHLGKELLKSIKLENNDYIHTTTIIDFSKYNTNDASLILPNQGGLFYYESIVNAIRDKDGNLEGIYVAGRNVTELVESFHQRQEGAILLKKATQHIKEYIDNINYTLQVSKVLLVNYYPSSFTMELSDIIGKPKIRLSQLRCIRLATPRFRRSVSSVLNRMDHLTRSVIELTIETEIRDNKGRQVFLMFNLIPILDKQGQVSHYFGMCRNMTDMVETERQLALETKKAQEAELLKESFLTNMSYEIRTPLASILGYAALFETEHDEADEPVFVDEIKKNTNELLQLINDILFISRLDADMVEFKNNSFDFAEYFDAYCQMGWSSINPEVKTSIENPYEHLVISGDAEQLGKVIQKLCMLSASFTRKGNVRAKYEYRREELVISIEDTGGGISPETLPKAFGRFARDENEKLCGTGLDLPIIEEIVKRMGGSVELQSEKGKGSTVWVFLPCEATRIEKKSEIMI
ncbi:MAG: HAMP domain-containing histidine kinase [Prevotella sp.]|nr:HAMP domain-containing histidine kinase [Prevotella sp.]